jgi:hypothetical protein
MESNSFEIGDLVSIKRIPQSSDDYTFIWDSIPLEGEDWLVVNVKKSKTSGLKPFSDELRIELKLFQGFEYALVKPYDLLITRNDIFQDTSHILREIITDRKLGHDIVELCLREHSFRYLVQKGIDRKKLFEEIFPKIADDIVNAPDYLFKSNGKVGEFEGTLQWIGSAGQTDHLRPEQADHLGRSKLTTQGRSKLTT